MNRGDILTVKKFAFTNKAGGTGLSDWKYNEKFENPIKVKVIKVLDDYETGQHGWATPVPEEKELLDYLDRNAKKGIPSFNRETDKTSYDDSDFYVLFISNSDVIKITVPEGVITESDKQAWVVHSNTLNYTALALPIRAIIITGDPADFSHIIIKSAVGSKDRPNYLNIYEDASEDLAVTRLTKEEVLLEFAIPEEMLKVLEGK